MPKLTLTVETVTPLLMNGANQTPEIRAASFRGLFRYWLRAVLGGVYQKDIEGLRKAEAKYFGNTDGVSPLRVHVIHNLEPTQEKTKYVLPPSVRNKQGNVVPYQHAGYHEAIPEDLQRFEIRLDTHPLYPLKSIFNRQLYSTLLLAFHLGAFGKRSRRGGGVLRVVKVQADWANEQQIDLFEHFQTLLQFRADNSEQLSEVLNQYVLPFVEKSQNNAVSGTAIPKYPTWTAQHVKVLIGKTGFSDDARIKAGQMTTPFSEGYRAALQQVWDISGKLKLHHMEDVWGFARSNGRRASAVHLHVHKGSRGQFYPIITIFRSGNGQWDKMQTLNDELCNNGYLALDFCKGVVWQ
jgi:CRISPR type III-B/RAMP module RAMP protein Cmr1